MKHLNKYNRSYAPSVFNNSLTFVDEILDNFWGSYHTTIEAKEEDDKYCFEVELPGFDKKDVDISILEGELKVSACNKKEKRERFKKIILPKDINSDSISAELKNGILKISIDKQVKELVKRIKVV
jgi:HSP20 family protein